MLAVLAAHEKHAGHAGHAARAAHAARALQAAHVTRDRGVPIASGTQRGKHACAQAQADGKREEEKRDKARGTALAASSSVFNEEISEGGRLTQRLGGAKMDAKAIVLEELKNGRNSDEIANALSLLTSLE